VTEQNKQPKTTEEWRWLLATPRI